MDTTRIERDLRFLKLYAGAMTLVVGVMSVAAFARGAPTQVGEIQGTRAKFDEIDVERINVIEPDGKYRLVISNRPRSIGPIYKRKPFGYEGGGRPGHDLVQRRRHGERRLHLHGSSARRNSRTDNCTASTARRRTCRSTSSTRTRCSIWTTPTTTAGD